LDHSLRHRYLPVERKLGRYWQRNEDNGHNVDNAPRIVHRVLGTSEVAAPQPRGPNLPL